MLVGMAPIYKGVVAETSGWGQTSGNMINTAA
jgi:hypothetical protein